MDLSRTPPRSSPFKKVADSHADLSEKAVHLRVGGAPAIRLALLRPPARPQSVSDVSPHSSTIFCLPFLEMKSITRQPRSVISHVSPKSRLRKTSEERREKQKVEATLRKLVGSDESESQLDLVLSVISYIRELQSQLECPDKENSLPADLEKLFSNCTALAASSSSASKPSDSNS
ncbi:unnamed protein product [Caenorhabditis auriculariae]|uniref:BHLH domain-containing protein n=1 Tax=Caenorhabditis auriculariae TaxID=2777116 RepID=A0A8S1HC27_9PELO|nr:unnamed protein product [Caenorhabditis auriculariae]